MFSSLLGSLCSRNEKLALFLLLLSFNENETEFKIFLSSSIHFLSFTYYIFFHYIIKALSAKHRNNRPPPSHEVEITEAEPSRTPEDSVCSIEGPTDTGGEASNFSASK